ncbi:hypothetical protein T4A_13825 [Trichinella pseudospiralis]|uniref:Uncharacterized protein n=1 Tax=Trichinella pseudospiralis TaxID=6337 RepID=A0A0V1E1G6_TRIPS|nr:hypothetical protein T4A_13825 [Trichinella pseudospiralis]
MVSDNSHEYSSSQPLNKETDAACGDNQSDGGVQVVITLAAAAALLLLCGWCRKKKTKGAPFTGKAEPMLVSLPLAPCYPEQTEAKQLILMVIPKFVS